MSDRNAHDPSVEEIARYRARFYLLNKWERRLAEEDLDDTAGVVRGYSPSGGQVCTDVPEIGGLIVDAGGSEVHLRLYRDSTVGFIEAGVEPGRAIMIDPMSAPCQVPTYLSGGVPETVQRVIDALGVSPRWADACPDGEHTFTVENEGTHPAYEFRKCTRCDNAADVLSWLGHYVPRRVGGDGR